MVVALGEWLPQFEMEIPKAKARLESEPSLAKFADNTGAARLETKSLEQMAERAAEQRKLAAETDKAKERPASV
jgi:alpha-galactosidase